ncbi:LysR family transcriptional regulator [Pseudomonas sp. o96-267]|uniref:LysR family transcriptional regulator n=1 Tax=Pseudomonas sp. o96-267 TaxID=2479853 RepID=UPI000F766C05|nr:LysR family transcriptional regulator [Pseudomonas sp. o96-267]RRV25720.1 LysR family transcriptional regulator [Pseudomonas sp. o96-267]
MNVALESKSTDTLRGLESFVKAVESGSIAAGARLLGISAAAASQNIARLEQSLGLRLLTRTTRRLALTDAGSLYFERVQAVLQELELARAAVADLQDEPRGQLRIATSAAFGRHVLAPLIPGFMAQYPRIRCELLTTDGSVDHVQEGVDISIHIEQQLQSGLVARRIATAQTRFCAAPAYLQRVGQPSEPEQLRDHDCLLFRVATDGRFLRWGFVREGVHFDAQVRVSMSSNDIDALAQCAASGGGITRLASFVADPYLARGDLVELFSSATPTDSRATGAPLDFYLCVRDRYELTPKVRLFIDYLQHALPADLKPSAEAR